MGLFDVFRISGSGVTLSQKWMDAVSDNIANLNTVHRTSESAFQARYVVARSVDYGSGQGGVEVAGAAFGSAQGQVVYDPNNPLADAKGMVRRPDIDLADQMTQLIQAQRGYQANIAVVERAKAAYEAALQLGRNA
jgi:flagellar basal-body rod protein FlgC